MEELKVYIWHVMFSKFKNNKNVTEITWKFYCVYDQGVISDYQVQNLFF